VTERVGSRGYLVGTIYLYSKLLMSSRVDRYAMLTNGVFMGVEVPIAGAARGQSDSDRKSRHIVIRVRPVLNRTLNGNGDEKPVSDSKQQRFKVGCEPIDIIRILQPLP
jgi:hypothetical protein